MSFSDSERKKSNEYILDMVVTRLEQSIKQACILAKNRHQVQEKKAALIAKIKSENASINVDTSVGTCATLNVEDLRTIFKIVNNMDVNVFNPDLDRKPSNVFRFTPAAKDTHLKRVALVRKTMKARDKEKDQIQKEFELQAQKREKARQKARDKLLFEEVEIDEF